MVDGTPDSWNVMWDEKYADNILTFNNPRDAFAIAQFLLGIDVNTTDKAEWDRAAEKLKEQNKVLQARVMDEVFNKMEGGNAALAPYYAGDFLTMRRTIPTSRLIYPKKAQTFSLTPCAFPQMQQTTTQL